jgi:hypothetical protein
MTEWSLPQLLASLHDEIEAKLGLARKTLAHPTVKGDASEGLWLELLATYLPERYLARRAHVVDSKWGFSEHIDVVIFDRQYSPLIFTMKEQYFIPAESVYAAFEAKQAINTPMIEYAQKKIASVRALHRTSLPIPYAEGTYKAKPPGHILGGILALDSDWTPALGGPLIRALSLESNKRLDLSCIARHGIVAYDDAGKYTVDSREKAATAFLLELIARLQAMATVPMIDTRAYAEWLTRE